MSLDYELVLKEEKVGYDVTTDEEKIKLKKIAEEKAEIRIANVEEFTKQYGKRPEGKVFRMLNTNDNFIALTKNDIHAIMKISGPMALYLYLKLAINREMGFSFDGEEENVFGNLDKYYMDGAFLCTLRTQGYVAKQLGTSQQNISNWFKKLEEVKFIRKVGSEKFITNNEEYIAPVYSLGELVNIKDFDEEVFYYELIK